MLLKLECLARTFSRCRDFSRGFRIVQARQTGVGAQTSALKPGGRCRGWEEMSRNIGLLVRRSDNAGEHVGSAAACPHAVPSYVSPRDPARQGRL